MWNQTGHRVIWCALLLTLVATTSIAAEPPWHDSLQLDGGGYWQARLPVTITNDGDAAVAGSPIELELSAKSPHTTALVDTPAAAIRVCDAAGVELLFDLYAPDGTPLHEGNILSGSHLVLPAVCPPHASATCYVYFDNPRSQRVPDYLPVRASLINGDMEEGAGEAPAAWQHDQADQWHQASWTDEVAQSGKKSLKIVVDPAAEPTWIKTHQAGISVVGGARYRFDAWVKASDAQGVVGWYLHVGNAVNSMLIAPMLDAGEGTYDWKRVELEFTVPPAANRLSLGTVLRGTGTAWFDNAQFECLGGGTLQANTSPVQRMVLDVDPSETTNADWPGELPEHRALVRVLNFADQPQGKSLVAVDLNLLRARMCGRLQVESLRVVWKETAIPHTTAGGALLFCSDIPARSASTFEVYFTQYPPSSPDNTPHTVPPSSLLNERNLVRNPGFELGQNTPDDWTSTGLTDNPDGVTFGIDSPAPSGVGNRAVRMQVPQNAPSAWRGWRQNVPVIPGHTYLLSAWVKCEGVDEGEIHVHLHRRTAQGELSKYQPMTSLTQAVKGTTDWRQISELMTMPEDTTELEIHLTSNTAGTVWHDDVLAAEVMPAQVVQWEGRPVAKEELAVWPVPSVVKVFRDDPVPATIPDATISAAGNEWETLQLAVRAGQDTRDVHVQVDPPRDTTGRQLDDIEVNIVGFVPIDHPSGYYQTDGPDWQRMIPRQTGQSDGWPGWWPDPLLPTDTTSLSVNSTQPIWITFKLPKNAAAGDYLGTIKLTAGGKILKQIPYRVHVWGFALPDQSHVAAIYDVRLGPSAELWQKPFSQMYPEIMRFMARRRLCPDTIQPPPSIRYEDGRVVADYQDFDKVATVYFDELKLPYAYTPWTFYLFGWGHAPKDFAGERPYDGSADLTNVDRRQLRPAYRKAYQACLKDFWQHLKEKGWDKKTILYISDEPFDHHPYIVQQMQALCDMIHEVDPTIPIYSSTWKHVPQWDGYLNVWGIGNDGRVPVTKMQKMQAAGARIWFTTDGQMCTDTPYCTIERLLPHFCFQYGAQAYEFWGIAWLTYDPYQYGWHSFIRQAGDPGKYYWIRYPNGDGFLLYPGGPIGYDGLVSSMRLEQAREGVEDYEYLWLLQQRMAAARQAGRDIAAAEQAMESAKHLITIPNAGARRSSEMLTDPLRIEAVRRKLADALEGLGP